VHYFETLTGFKYIGEKIRQFEESPEEYEFLFGAEESYGFLYGTHARDKDAIVTSCLLAEAALLQKQKKQTLVDLLYTLYEKFGVYYEKQLSITLPDTEQSHKKIAQALQNLRENPPYDFLNLKLACLQDAKLSYEEDCQTREKKQLSLPKSDVLVYHVSDGSTYVIRPSGTEPKIKIYGMMHTLKKHAIDTTLQQLDTTLSAHLKTLHSRYLNL